MELRERGYCGGYTMGKMLVASLKLKEVADPVIRFETELLCERGMGLRVARRGKK